MTIQVLRVQNPYAFELPEIEALVRAAYDNHGFMDFDTARAELEFAVTQDDTGLFIAREGGKYRGIIHAIAPRDSSINSASVPHFYCQRAPKVREALIEAMVNFVSERGYTRLITVDASRKPRAFTKLLESVGKAKEVGRVFEFDLKESKYGVASNRSGGRVGSGELLPGGSGPVGEHSGHDSA